LPPQSDNHIPSSAWWSFPPRSQENNSYSLSFSSLVSFEFPVQTRCPIPPWLFPEVHVPFRGRSFPISSSLQRLPNVPLQSLVRVRLACSKPFPLRPPHPFSPVSPNLITWQRSPILMSEMLIAMFSPLARAHPNSSHRPLP